MKSHLRFLRMRKHPLTVYGDEAPRARYKKRPHPKGQGHNYYSVLRASTGSFLAASDEGTRPAMNVRVTLMPISVNATPTGSSAAA